MAQLSSQGNNAIIYLTYIALLASGLFLAWKFASNNNFLSSNGTQRGLPLAVNFIASGMFIRFFQFPIYCNLLAGAVSFLSRTETAETKPFGLDQVHSCVRKVRCITLL